MIHLTPGAQVMGLAPLTDVQHDRIVAVTSAGNLLAIAASELPELDKGKGNKLIDIPKTKLATERLVAVIAVASSHTLLLYSGERTMHLSFKDLEAYLDTRGSRGQLLPRSWHKIDTLDIQ